MLFAQTALASRECRTVFDLRTELRLPSDPLWFATRASVMAHFPPIAMLDSMRAFDWKHVHYFTPEEKTAFLLRADAGRLVDPAGLPLTSVRLLDFVIDGASDIYAYPARAEGSEGTRHSSATEGEPAFFTGEIYISLGKITLITNSSGHYAPSDVRFTAALVYLDLIGLDLSQTRMRFFSGRNESEFSTGDSTVYDFLRYKVRGWQPAYRGATFTLE